jgi:uncharacterized protein (TIGR03083 family)
MSARRDAEVVTEMASETNACMHALQGAATRTAGLLRGVPDPNATAPGLSWTVAETAAHIVGDLRCNTGLLTGERDADEFLKLAPEAKTAGERSAAVNARLLDEITERDVHRLADMVTAAAADFADAAATQPDGKQILSVNGLPMTVHVMTAAMLGEQLVHGLDIARAAHAQWPISREEALLVIDGVVALMPGYVDAEQAAGMHVTYELRFRGGPRYQLRIDDGKAAVSAPGQKADCVISADPVAFLLVGYGRVGQWSQVLRGKIISGGRKPWLGLTFGKIISSV